MGNLKNRVGKLEAASIPSERPFLMRVIVPAKDDKPYGTENGIQRIHCGDQTWLRDEGESEEAFIARARAEGQKDDDLQPEGMAAVYRGIFTADYGDFDA